MGGWVLGGSGDLDAARGFVKGSGGFLGVLGGLGGSLGGSSEGVSGVVAFGRH